MFHPKSQPKLPAHLDPLDPLGPQPMLVKGPKAGMSGSMPPKVAQPT